MYATVAKVKELDYYKMAELGYFIKGYTHSCKAGINLAFYAVSPGHLQPITVSRQMFRKLELWSIL